MGNMIAMTMLGALLSLQACSRSPGIDPDVPASRSERGTEPSTSDVPAVGKPAIDAAPAKDDSAEDDSEVVAQIEAIGSGTVDEYKSVFMALQKAVAAGDKAAVSRMADFPLNIWVDGWKVVTNAEQFVNDYDRIITPAIAKKITAQKFSDALVNTQGVMFGKGEVLLSGSCADEACKKHLVAISRIEEASEGDPEFPLTVAVKLSDAAAKRLKSKGETVKVAVVYYGFADPSALGQADDLGMVDLGSTERELAVGAGKAVFDGSRFDRKQLQFVSGGPRVNINVISGRRASGDNNLDCDIYEGNLVIATRTPISLNCKLLREG